MKKISLILIGLLFIPTLFLTSCDNGDDPVVVEPAFTILKNYMVANSMDIPDIMTNADGDSFVVAAPATEAETTAFLDKYHVIDIRAKADYDAGHISVAKNVAFANILTEVTAATKPVLVVCYSGQTACYATALMRMYGYPKTRALKWGMSGWNSANAVNSWDKQIGKEEAKGHNNWTYAGAPSNQVFTNPTIASLKTEGSQLLKERVEQVVAASFGAATVSGTDVLNNPTNYFINNYFSEVDYTGFGHINGAYRILPLKLADPSYLGLDPTPATKVVTYCYTGQTSAVMTACLRVLGYNAYTMTYGMNGIYNTNPQFTKNQWGVDSKPKNYPTVPTN